MLEQDFVEDPDLIIDINVRRALREVPELRDKTIPKDNLAKRLNDIYFSAPNLKPFSAIHEKFTQTNFKAIRNVGDQALDEVPLEDPEPNFARSTLHYKTKTSVQRHKGNRITAYFSKVFSRHHATDSHISDKFIIVPKTEPEGRQEHHPVGATDNEPTKSPEKYEQQVKNENQGQLQANNANDKDKPAEPIKGPVEEKVTQQPHSIVPSDKTSIDNPKNQNLIAGNESVYRKLNDSFILDNRNQNRHIGMFNKDYKFETISEVKQPDGTMRYTIEGLEVLDDLPDYINLQSVKSLIEQTAALGNESTGPNDIRGSNLRMQALRSASHWSIGLQETEHSIQNCYLDLIDNAERFIYIENQFFISSWVKETSGNIKNLIIKALFSRILRAHREGKDFKVIVFMPLMPAAEGDLDKKGGKVLQTLMALENFTIGEGQDSLIEKIRAHCGDPAKYFMICGLRKYDYHPLVDKNGKRVIDPATGLAKKDLSGDPMTELIYIHSKLIIADDKRMLLGSANINDRSLLGYRDSELAVYIEGDLDLEFNSSSHLEHHISAQVNSTIHNFRKHIFKEHFGMAENEVIDPGHDRFWTEAWNIVKFNTMFYDYVFKIYPSNKYLTWEELAKRERGFNKKAFEELRPFVKGHAVRYPYAFLIKEALESAKNKDFGLLVAPDKILY
jgi:phosphatidylserine/phosphatidylglycerophosphate/cardiolipin synthase-like enzyme